MSRHRPAWPVLLYLAAGLLLCDTVFSAVTGLAWPGQRYPDWATRVNSAVFLLAAIAGGGAALGWRQARRKTPR
jgi:hypothetical protein